MQYITKTSGKKIGENICEETDNSYENDNYYNK